SKTRVNALMAGNQGPRAPAPGPPLPGGERMRATTTTPPPPPPGPIGGHRPPITCAGGPLRPRPPPPARAGRAREPYGERAERFLELSAAARADQRHDVLAARADPGEGELRGRGVLLARDRAERAHERHVARKVFG